VAIVCDLDGVIWLGRRPIPGVAEAVARLRAAGHRVLFVTNNSASPVAGIEGRLAAMGVPAEGDVVTSAMAGASLVRPGERVHMIGGPGLVEALERRGAEVVEGTDADVVVVGRDTRFDFAMLAAAATAIRGGARFVATNDDSTVPTPDGLEPGNGAIVAAVATAAGVTPIVAGKPNQAIAAVVRAVLVGETDPLPERGAPVTPLGDLVAVGDRADTDGRFARALGGRFGLVLSGVTKATDLPVTPAPDLVGQDLADLATQLGA
jgi:4-nitrophenyl phosphatase